MIDDKDMTADNFFETNKVETRYSLLSDGRVTSRQQPAQVTFRLPAKQVQWLTRTVDGNKNYAIAKILEYGIAKIKEQLVEGDFDIDDLKNL